jgi:hypothetical protein
LLGDHFQLITYDMVGRPNRICLPVQLWASKVWTPPWLNCFWSLAFQPCANLRHEVREDEIQQRSRICDGENGENNW